MNTRAFASAITIGMLVCGLSACGRPRQTSNNSLAAATRARLRLRCEQQSARLQCQAVASDELDVSSKDRDVTDAVEWTSSDADAVRVQRGHIQAAHGGVATVTATWVGAPGAPSASVVVIADPLQGETRQAYVIEGQVRLFPTADGAGGARVSMIGPQGELLETVMTPSDPAALGQFRFRPVAAGTYTLRAERHEYRSTEKTFVVPGDSTPTLTLLPEPAGSANN